MVGILPKQAASLTPCTETPRWRAYSRKETSRVFDWSFRLVRVADRMWPHFWHWCVPPVNPFWERHARQVPGLPVTAGGPVPGPGRAGTPWRRIASPPMLHAGRAAVDRRGARIRHARALAPAALVQSRASGKRAAHPMRCAYRGACSPSRWLHRDNLHRNAFSVDLLTRSAVHYQCRSIVDRSRRHASASLLRGG